MRSKVLINSVKSWTTALGIAMVPFAARAKEPLLPTEIFSIEADAQRLPRSPVGNQLEGDLTREETNARAELKLRLSDMFVLTARGSFGRATDGFFTYQRHKGELTRSLVSGDAGLEVTLPFSRYGYLMLNASAGGLQEKLAPAFDGVALNEASAEMPYACGGISLGVARHLLVYFEGCSDVRMPIRGGFEISQRGEGRSAIAPTLSVDILQQTRATGYELFEPEGPVPISSVIERRANATIEWRLGNIGLGGQTNVGLFGNPDNIGRTSHGADANYGPQISWFAPNGFVLTAGLPFKSQDESLHVTGFVGLRFTGHGIDASVSGAIPEASYVLPYEGRLRYGYQVEVSELQTEADRVFAEAEGIADKRKQIETYTHAGKLYAQVRASGKGNGIINKFKVILAHATDRKIDDDTFVDKLMEMSGKNAEASIAIGVRWPNEADRKDWKQVAGSGIWKLKKPVAGKEFYVAEVYFDNVWYLLPINLAALKEKLFDAENPRGFVKTDGRTGASIGSLFTKIAGKNLDNEKHVAAFNACGAKILELMATQYKDIRVIDFEGVRFYVPLAFGTDSAAIKKLLANAGFNAENEYRLFQAKMF